MIIIIPSWGMVLPLPCNLSHSLFRHCLFRQILVCLYHQSIVLQCWTILLILLFLLCLLFILGSFLFPFSVDCSSPPSLENGLVSFNCSFPHCPAVYSCQEGYLLNGSDYVTCTDAGTWTDTSHVCERKSNIELQCSLYY